MKILFVDPNGPSKTVPFSHGVVHFRNRPTGLRTVQVDTVVLAKGTTVEMERLALCRLSGSLTKRIFREVDD